LLTTRLHRNRKKSRLQFVLPWHKYRHSPLQQSSDWNIDAT
jgi:hypothetical protein